MDVQQQMGIVEKECDQIDYSAFQFMSSLAAGQVNALFSEKRSPEFIAL